MELNVSVNKIADLMRDDNGPHASLFIPTHHNGIEVRQDMLRFKNCLHQAENQLVAGGMKCTQARRLCEQAARLLEDDSFWHHLDRGLALFISNQRFDILRLPLIFHEIVVTGAHFYIRPLLRLFNEIERFFLMALSANSFRFFLGTQDALTRVTVKDAPESMAEALCFDDPEGQLQFHTGTANTSCVRPAMYHGQGLGHEGSTENMYRYVKQIDRALQKQIGTTSSPLVFAGVESLYSLFREITGCKTLLDRRISGNTDLLDPHELHQRAWPLIEKHVQERANTVLSRYREYDGTDITSLDMRIILKYVFQGRVESLLINTEEHIWGRYSISYDQVILHGEYKKGDEDLIDVAAVNTLLKGGMVYVLEKEINLGSPVAALFRY
jgi:hypothetical protein